MRFPNRVGSRGMRSVNAEGSRGMRSLKTEGSRGMRSLNVCFYLEVLRIDVRGHGDED